MQRGPFFIAPDDDVYENDRWLHWLLWFIVGVYVVTVLLYGAILVNNTAFEHTYVKHPSAPGVLTSARYSLDWWAYSVMSMVVVVFPLVVMLWIIFRKQYGCNVLWFIIFLLAFIAHTGGCVVLSVSYAQCNDDGQANNPCNSKLWCCAPEIYTNVANDCANALPCTPPVTLGELTPDADFVWFYWTSIYFALFHIVFAGIVISYWCYNPDTEDATEFIPVERPVTKYSTPSTIVPRGTGKAHGVKKRIKPRKQSNTPV